MKRVFLLLLSIGWVVMLYKTIQVSAAQPDSFVSYYFGEMLANSWQSHFNVDLLVHSILFSCWILYRESSLLKGVICAICSIALGAVFSFLYLLVVIYISKGNLFLVINGNKR